MPSRKIICPENDFVTRSPNFDADHDNSQNFILPFLAMTDEKYETTKKGKFFHRFFNSIDFRLFSLDKAMLPRKSSKKFNAVAKALTTAAAVSRQHRAGGEFFFVTKEK